MATKGKAAGQKAAGQHTPTPRIDQILLMHSARSDKWRDITHLAAEWASGRGDRAALEAAVSAMAPVEEYHAYPERHLVRRLRAPAKRRISIWSAWQAPLLITQLLLGLVVRQRRPQLAESLLNPFELVSKILNLSAAGLILRA